MKRLATAVCGVAGGLLGGFIAAAGAVYLAAANARHEQLPDVTRDLGVHPPEAPHA